MPNKTDILIGHIMYRDKYINILYRHILKDTICKSEWKGNSYHNIIVGDIFRDNIYKEDLEPIIYHELYHLHYGSKNEYEADRYACSIVGYDRFEKAINKYCRKILCRNIHTKYGRMIYDSYCKYRLDACKDTKIDHFNLDIYKPYNLELI